ncbi:mCG1036081, partial [Mus musculus]
QDRVSLWSPGCPGTHSIDQVGLELTKICLPQHPDCCNQRHVPPPPRISSYFLSWMSKVMGQGYASNSSVSLTLPTLFLETILPGALAVLIHSLIKIAIRGLGM